MEAKQETVGSVSENGQERNEVGYSRRDCTGDTSGYCVRDTECERTGEHHYEEHHRNHRSVGSGD